MNRFQKLLSFKTILSGIVLIIVGAIFFIILNNKKLAYVLFIGGLIHFVFFAFTLYKDKQSNNKDYNS